MWKSVCFKRKTMRELNESQIIPIYVVYQILKKLTTPFSKTQAFKLGIIDENGKVLRKRYTLKTQQERESYTILDGLVWKLKKLLEKIPFGKSKLASYAAALWLIKESSNHNLYYENEDLMETSFSEFAETVNLSDKEKYIASQLENIVHEQIANVTGPGVATDIPFKPMIKKSIKHLNLDFYKMYESIKRA